MNEQIIIELIKKELANHSDRNMVEKPLTQYLDGRNIQVGRGTGTRIGTGTDQKLGFFNKTPIIQPTTLTTAETEITHVAPGSADYAFGDVVNGGWGFSTADEARTLLLVIKNLQIRLAEAQTKIKALGLTA